MRLGRLIVLAAVVIALGAWILLVERHGPTTEELKERENKLFPTLEQDKVTGLVVDNSHGHFVLKREKGEWKLTAPLADAANQGAVTSLLSSLVDLKAERTLEGKDVKPAEYGLEKPKITLGVTEEGGKEFTLKLGNEMPLGNNRAAATSGDAIYLVGKWIASDLDKDLAGWRSTELANVLATDVASLSIRAGYNHIELAHSSAGWTLTEPVSDLADGERAEQLVGDLNSARIKEFLDTPPPLSSLGLEPPKVQLTVVRKDEKAPVQLAFGNEREKDKAKQVACRRGDRVFWVDASATSHLATVPTEWRSKSLVHLQTWEAEALTIDAEGASVTVQRKGGKWQVNGTDVAYDPVAARLGTLADLKVEDFDRPKPTGQPLGKVSVKTSTGAEVVATFYPGATSAEDLAVVPGRAGTLAVDSERVKELLASPAALAKPKATPTPVVTPSPAPTVIPQASPTPVGKR
jgi:hypothetical protein